jgi:hypothetical protein
MLACSRARDRNLACVENVVSFLVWEVDASWTWVNYKMTLGQSQLPYAA